MGGGEKGERKVKEGGGAGVIFPVLLWRVNAVIGEGVLLGLWGKEVLISVKRSLFNR